MPPKHLIGLCVVWALLALLGPGCSPEPEPQPTREAAAEEEEMPDFDKLWDYSDPAATEKKFRDLMIVAETSGDLSYQLQLETQIARTQGLQQQFEAAHETLDGVEARLGPETTVARIRYLLERGRAFNSSKQAEKARPLFLEAWELGQEAGEDGYAVDAAHMLGIIEPPGEALGWNERALELARSSEQPGARAWLGSLLNNMGWTYHGQGEYEKALELFREALAYREEKQQAKQILIAQWCVARTLRSLGRTEEALAMQQTLRQEHEAAGSRDGYVYEELAECYLLLDQPDEAQRFFALAYAELSQDPWLNRDEPERIARLKKLGRVAGEPRKPE